MTENDKKDPRTTRRTEARETRIPLEFQAFHQRFYRPYRRYAELLLGDEEIAKQVVHRVFYSLLVGWKRLMEEANPRESAWGHLKEAVDDYLVSQDREPAITETAAFYYRFREQMDDLRDRFAALETGLGLYAAISKLPPRQLDVVVLHYVFAFSRARTADILGVEEATVRSHLTYARRRLADELGIDLDTNRTDN
ncbi:sigma-70 family RNA polymerase sigma factor [Streptomyces sp. DSM 42041]|uniref:Sigma-70 family RNA polymerase sigma factor n=1 Tax=Streptomyces hazeniae TaxID=3075538 RepID=A0ABU2NYW0_9ACTN|nr:sigma-70 family RNA polymerase sigma factor [Streptomyces sp. DSM 42041]MDT0382175.1 sigma-70 family RNA polymerase sigma factor [Streptomyces sp. DSM 42041]